MTAALMGAAALAFGVPATAGAAIVPTGSASAATNAATTPGSAPAKDPDHGSHVCGVYFQYTC